MPILSVSGVGQQRQMTRALDRCCEVTLMSCAGAGHAARKDLASLGHEAAQTCDVLVINVLYLVNAEASNLLAGLSAAVVGSFSHCGFSFRENI